MMKIVLIGKLLEREFITNVTGNITVRYLKFHIKILSTRFFYHNAYNNFLEFF